jgi:hypothetical protein
MLHPEIEPRWAECIVAASGPSLSELAAACRGLPIVAVNDSHRILPHAEILYACDAKWWDVHSGCPDFAGEKWSCHGSASHNDKMATAHRYGLNLVRGEDGEGFSLDPSKIHYGSNSGFQAINLAILFGAKRILLVGFDMSSRTKSHFFGDHPAGLIRCNDYERFIPQFERAARRLPPDIEVINCTPGSALRCFPMMDIQDALSVAA